ncbi:very short patch repair endonuclease [Roseicyclus sp. F158]|uniref:Very short patch repair endonuclease n=1 Tax=Tropicimonas omnivorans TaxID=3075590 RepID=A0ABU3DI73_9RHOB|nr:very short patch repair endonuclease [Roseicyclus sp. F158]MDT0683411.1 very short patch repair endonuclease [Roseicyclus sp. F158]
MADTVSPEVRSRMMAANRRKDTGPELLVRRHLHAQGLRFRLDVRKLPGSPDLVLTRHRAAIFVHGCYWHRHQGCRFATTPKSNQAFWVSKFASNVERDERAIAALQHMGWRVGVVWECALKSSFREHSLSALVAWVQGGPDRIEIPARAPC